MKKAHAPGRSWLSYCEQAGVAARSAAGCHHKPDREDVVNCPNCSAPMGRLAMEGVYGPEIEVDLCFACHALWLDKRESLHLTPRGTLDLFRVLHEHRDDARHALAGRQACPHCGRRLSLHRDIGKGGRFTYYACPAGDGRLTPFSEFLKEKEFVRALTPLEQQRLRAEIRTVQCSSCGAPVDLASGFQCAHCGSPITVLDADAVERTLRQLESADQKRSIGVEERELRARAVASMESMRSHPDDRLNALAARHRVSVPSIESAGAIGLDLLMASIGFIFGKR